jgi:predicted RNA binding protein YcfA (HicA-like mRNA interferase family)
MSSARASDFRRAALALGFVRDRQRGSHEFWKHSDGRTITIPIHGSRDIGSGL